MKTNFRISILACSLSILVSGCSSVTPGEKPGSYSSLPDWVTTPQQQVPEGAMVDTTCVRANASMGILKNKATAQARANIAQNIQTNVQAMDKTYQSLTESGEDESGYGETFESVSKQVTDQMLEGAIPERVDYIPPRNEDSDEQLCVMVVLAPEKNRKVFENIIEASNRDLSPDNEELMYQEYRAKRAQEELEQSTE